jgi:hypothetical protein
VELLGARDTEKLTEPDDDMEREPETVCVTVAA